MQTNTKIGLAFVAGFLVAKNEEEIKQLVLPHLRTSEDRLGNGYSSIIKFFLEQKDLFEDLFAESQAKGPRPVESLEVREQAER